MTKVKIFSLLSLSTTALLSLALAAPANAKELVLYSARAEELIKPVLDAYTAETGVKIQLHTDKEGPLLERLLREDKRTPADILITVDAGNLWLAAQKGVLQPVDSKILKQHIPAAMRDSENRWFGFSVRARTIMYNSDKVKPSDLSSYEALGEPKWKGRLCLRTSKKVYNQSLVAMMIAEHGEEKTEKTVRSWIQNLATDVFPDDTLLIKAIASGKCDVGIANTYYLGRLLKDQPNLPAKLFWANQNGSGVHVNVSGAGVVKHSKQKAEAIRFLEWLSQEKAQSLFAGLNLEFPVVEKAPWGETTQSWGKFKPNPTNLSKAGELQEAANRLMDRAQYK